MVRKLFSPLSRRAWVLLVLLVPAMAATASADQCRPAAPPPVAAAPIPDLPALDPPAAGFVLGAADADRYRAIFLAQEAGDFATADALIPMLQDPILAGHILQQRHLHPASGRASFAELAAWLEAHADHPGARRIHSLADRRRPEGAPALPPPEAAATPVAVAVAGDPLKQPPLTSAPPGLGTPARGVAAAVAQRLGEGRITDALTVLDTPAATSGLSALQFDILHTEIAAHALYAGELRRASVLASRAADRSALPRALWLAGLAAWRLERLEDAGRRFEALAAHDQGSTWIRAAAAYWASRVALRSGRPADVAPWLEQAAAHPTTFYGLVAIRALGQEPPLDWASPRLTVSHLAALYAQPAARRALALLDVGERARAEEELAALPAEGELGGALLVLADRFGLASLSVRLAGRVPGLEGALQAAALLPMPPWRPIGGLSVDRALLFAIMRVESVYDPSARNSHSGATGLMQLMPATARYIDDDGLLAGSDPAEALLDPAVNLELAQRYILHLRALPQVQGDLFRLAAAYNAGPGRLGRWLAELGPAAEDPLLFIESLPAGQTRAYVESVLTGYWLYRFRLGQPTPSLDRVAAGLWPRHLEQRGSAMQVAETDGALKVASQD